MDTYTIFINASGFYRLAEPGEEGRTDAAYDADGEYLGSYEVHPGKFQGEPGQWYH